MDDSEDGTPKSKCSLKRILWGILIFILGGLIILVSCYLVPKIIELEHEINALKKENKYYENQTSNELTKRINEHEISFRRLIENRSSDLQKEILQIKAENKSASNARDDLRQSFEDIKDHIDAVIVEIFANLSKLVLSQKSSLDSISSLHSNLNETQNDLIRLRKKLTQLNSTLYTATLPFIVGAMDNLKQEVNTLRNSTTASVRELLKHWNRTDAEVEDVIKLLSRQNESLHFKIAYHSDVLSSEVHDVEKKQSKFRNYTIRNMKDIRIKINQTQQSLQQTLSNAITRANTSWHKRLADITKSLRLSMKKIHERIDEIKKGLETNMDNIINEQKGIKTDFSEMKTRFQEKDRKHDSDISAQRSEMKKVKKTIKDLEEKLNSNTRKRETLEKSVQNLQRSVNEIKNKANQLLGSYLPFILLVYQYLS